MTIIPHNIGDRDENLVRLRLLKYNIFNVYFINLSFPWHNFSINIVRHLPLLPLVLFCSMTPGGVIIRLVVSGIAMITYCYILNVYIAPNQEVVNIIISIRKRFKILQ